MNLDWISTYSFLIDGLTLLVTFYFFTKRLQGASASPFHVVCFLLCSMLSISLIPSMLGKFFSISFFLAAAGTLFYGAKIKHALLYAVLLMTVMQLCFGISNAILSMVNPFFYPTASKMLPVCMVFIGSLMALVPMYLCYLVLDRHFALAPQEQNTYVRIILIPLLMIFLSSAYINHTVYGDTVILEAQRMMLLSGHLQTLAIQLMGILSLFCMLSAYQKLIGSFHLITALSLLKQEHSFQEQYAAEAKARYEQTKAFRHDLKNHFTILKGLLEKKQLTQAKHYIEKLDNITAVFSFPYQTNHPVLDILIENKLGHAVQLGIHAECQLHLPAPCTIDAVDLCIILANALDNAICACQKLNDSAEKWIAISGAKQGDFLLIEIENSCGSQQSFHCGTGLSNIKSVTEAYQGSMDITCKDHIFSLSVLLIIPQQQRDISQQTYCNEQQNA